MSRAAVRKPDLGFPAIDPDVRMCPQFLLERDVHRGDAVWRQTNHAELRLEHHVERREQERHQSVSLIRLSPSTLLCTVPFSSSHK